MSEEREQAKGEFAGNACASCTVLMRRDCAAEPVVGATHAVVKPCRHRAGCLKDVFAMCRTQKGRKFSEQMSKHFFVQAQAERRVPSDETFA